MFSRNEKKMLQTLLNSKGLVVTYVRLSDYRSNYDKRLSKKLSIVITIIVSISAARVVYYFFFVLPYQRKIRQIKKGNQEVWFPQKRDKYIRTVTSVQLKYS